jgi:hypothetical protein
VLYNTQATNKDSFHKLTIKTGADMAKYKGYNYSQEVLIPISLEEQLMPGTLEFAIHTLVETHMNMAIFDDRYSNDEIGRWAYEPQDPLEGCLVWLFSGVDLFSKNRACMLGECNLHGAVLLPVP